MVADQFAEVALSCDEGDDRDRLLRALRLDELREFRPLVGDEIDVARPRRKPEDQLVEEQHDSVVAEPFRAVRHNPDRVARRTWSTASLASALDEAHGDRRALPAGRVIIACSLVRLRRFTPARTSRVRTAHSTGLQFMLDHARARDAVHAALDFDAIGQSLRERGWEVVHVRSAAGDRTEYLRRPDLGHRLSPAGRAAIKDQSCGSDIAIVAADGQPDALPSL